MFLLLIMGLKNGVVWDDFFQSSMDLVRVCFMPVGGTRDQSLPIWNWMLII